MKAASNATHAPHINVGIFAKGLQRQLFTRIYFSDEPANANDPVLHLVPHEYRATLLARPDSSDATRYVFDIWLQGDKETVYFQA
jgi:protocatechuate 3,4-dioxygenase alpha subunit